MQPRHRECACCTLKAVKRCGPQCSHAFVRGAIDSPIRLGDNSGRSSWQRTVKLLEQPFPPCPCPDGSTWCVDWKSCMAVVRCRILSDCWEESHRHVARSWWSHTGTTCTLPRDAQSLVPELPGLSSCNRRRFIHSVPWSLSLSRYLSLTCNMWDSVRFSQSSSW